MFGQESYSTEQFKMSKGDRLLLYTDGLSEARNYHDREYGDDRLGSVLGECHQLPAISTGSKSFPICLDELSSLLAVLTLVDKP